MARTAIVAQTTQGAYPALPVAAGSADITFTGTSDPTDRFTPIIEAKTLVIVKNDDTSSHTITFTSVADTPFNRSGDITAYVVGPGKISQFGPFRGAGWASSGNLLIDVSDSNNQIAVITLP